MWASLVTLVLSVRQHVASHRMDYRSIFHSLQLIHGNGTGPGETVTCKYDQLGIFRSAEEAADQVHS